MRHRSGNGWWIFLLFFFMVIPGVNAIWPLFLIIAIVLGVTFASIHASKKLDEENGYTHTRMRGYRTESRYSSADLARINVWLRKWFRSHDRLVMNNGDDIRVHGERYASLGSLDVYQNNRFVCPMNDFEKRYPDEWNDIMQELLSKSSQDTGDDVIDAEVVEPSEEEETVKQEEVHEEKKEPSDAQSYIDQINQLNTDITDEEISEGLYETSSLLKQIQTMSVKFPDSRPKLKKLYEYYLPILIRSLKQFDNLQTAKTDPSYEETRNKLARTVSLINEAMKKIISSMTDDDFINLSADLSTLESILQKDGLTDDGMMHKDDDHEQG